MACGEGYGSDVLARSAASVVGVDANPEAHEHARLRYRRREPALRARPRREFAEPADAVVFLQTIEHLQDPGAVLEHFRSLRRRARDGVRLHPQRAHARARGRAALGQPLARARVPRRGVRGAVPRHFAIGRAVRPVPRPQAARARARAARGLGLACTRAAASPSASTTGSRRRSPLGLRAAPGAAEARPGPRAGLPRGVPRRERRGATRGALAIVLHTHMPYVEGFGTWPFGEEWLWEAIAGCYLPLLELLDAGRAADAVADAGAVRPARGARAAPSASQRFVEEVRRDTHARGRRRAARRRARGARARARARLGATTSARSSGWPSAAGDLLGALAPHAQWTSSATHAVLPLLATDAGVRAAGADRDRRRTGAASAPSWRGGFWLPECAYAPWLEPALADAGVRAVCVELTGRFGLGAREHLRPLVSESGVVLVPIDRATISLVWSDDGYPAERRLPRLPPPHRPPPQPVGQRRRRLRPRARARARARARRRLRRAHARAPARAAPGLPGRRAGGVRARHRAARPLVVRGPRLAGGGRRGVLAPGPRAGAPGRRARALARAARRRRASGDGGAAGEQLGGATATSRPGRARPVAEMAFAARAAELEAARRAVAGAPVRRRCASCSRCRPATGRSWSPAGSPCPTRASASRATAGARARRCATGRTRASSGLRNLAVARRSAGRCSRPERHGRSGLTPSASSSGASRMRITRAGTPPTTAFSGTSS